MAKTIKFNLILDGYSVRNMEGLREHFSIEDILKYYENGLLLRWLKVREYDKEYEAVAGLKKELETKERLVNLIKIFDIETNEKEIEYGVSVLDYELKEKAEMALYNEKLSKKWTIINNYLAGYKALIAHLEENSENMSILKADAIEWKSII